MPKRIKELIPLIEAELSKSSLPPDPPLPPFPFLIPDLGDATAALHVKALPLITPFFNLDIVSQEKALLVV